MKMTTKMAVLAAGAALAAASTAHAAQGCGPGFHRNGWGHCRPNGFGRGPGPGWAGPGPGPVVGRWYGGRGYWYGNRYWGHRRWWHGGWSYY